MADNDNQIPPAAFDPATRYLLALSDFGFGPPVASPASPDEPVSWTASYLRAAATGADPVAPTVRALRTFLQAIPRGDLAVTSPGVLADLHATVTPAFHRLVLEAPQGVNLQNVAIGMGALRWLVEMFQNPPSRDDLMKVGSDLAERVDWIALLADELDASLRRRRLEERGGNVARMAVCAAALQRTDTAGLPLH